MTLVFTPKVDVEALADAPPEDPSEISAADTATEVRGGADNSNFGPEAGPTSAFYCAGSDLSD